MKIEVVRYEFLEDRTIGKLFLDDVFFCYTLEDRVRPPDVKVYGQTAIPEGTYLMTIEPFRGDKTRMYPLLHNVPMFFGICIHGGNVPEDTLGCLLVGFNRDDQKIYNSSVKPLVQKIQETPKPWEVIIRNGG